jgi:predicted  nucleic acid-binding Zn-ribbon protein
MKESLEFYIKLSDDYNKRLTNEIKAHNEEVKALYKENSELKKEIKEQEKRFDEKIMANQREITLMKNQMLSVYG